ncbi:solute carrier family 2, facilitated glucose transporter member 5-like [Sceloporus undulatus]|uniref:solute carrier family 2, facilitated glucose transporter member 5-like n=1 Tax=Sceloporus undulatus TaxID=8520 RepID=UPI001C4CA068|nr:solute carrier family 2, facilitated glucose transporter member 5-like [Sceloporus undulatus]
MSLRGSEDLDDDTTNKEGELTWMLFFATLISTLGSSLQYGYNLTVINYPAKFLKSFYNETYRERNNINVDHSILMFFWGLTVSFFQVGAICGALLAGPLVDACGRKGTLLALNALVIVSAILQGSSRAVHSYELIIIGRLVIGGCVGVSYSVVPMYITELAPPNLRDSLGMVPHLFIVCGELLANVFGLRHILGTEESWPLLLSLIAFPALFQMVLLPFFPESPRYLLIQKRNETEAKQALQKLRGWDDVEDEIEELYLEDSTEKEEKNMDVLKILHYEDLQWQLTAIIVLMGGQQLSGINAARHYTEEMYLYLGLEEEQLPYATLLLTTLLMIMIIIALCIVGTLGLRSLLLTGFGICSFSCILLAMTIELQKHVPWMPRISTALLTVFLIGQSIGPDPVVNVLVSEFFLQSSRSTAFVITGTLHWLCKFLTTVVYLHMETDLEPYSFVIFWPFSVAAFISLSKILPKMKNKTFVEVRRTIAIHVARRILMQSLPVHSH